MQITEHTDLLVYQKAFQITHEIFAFTLDFPKHEQYSLTDQVRRSSRSICANIGEAWRKRRYPAAFVAKLNDAESEAAETQVWLQFALHHGYVDERQFRELKERLDEVIRMLVAMIVGKDKWCLSERK